MRHQLPDQKEKILLALLPFWTAQLPPQGISCLKGFLQQHPREYNVKAVDTNILVEFKTFYDSYFNRLKENISAELLSNFFNIGHDVLRNHLMAHLNYKDEILYKELIKELVFKTFYTELTEPGVNRLIEVVREFYTYFEVYFSELLAKEKPTVLGLSVYSGTLPTSLLAFKLAKQHDPRIHTVMGGGIFSDQLNVNSPDFPDFLEQTPYIDHIIIGEGEILFSKLLAGELELSTAKRVYTLSDINRETLDLSCAPLPDFSDFNLQQYPQLTAYASRSCPFKCGFCSETIQWGKYRQKSASQVVKELTTLSKICGMKLFLMGDSLLNPILGELSREILAGEGGIYWDGYLRADKEVCNTENTMLWRRGGFYRARLGVESGSQLILDRMNKHITIEQIRLALFSLAYAGIKTTTYWVIGYPGETETDFQKTLDFIEELKNYIYEAECNPFNYYRSGQVKSGRWTQENTAMPVYKTNEQTGNILMIRTWSMKGIPSREETYQRVNRFVQHCRRLGIPNPYTLNEIYQADERWKRLHPNAVPSIVEIKDNTIPRDESKKLRQLVFMENPKVDEEDFGF